MQRDKQKTKNTNFIQKNSCAFNFCIYCKRVATNVSTAVAIHINIQQKYKKDNIHSDSVKRKSFHYNARRYKKKTRVQIREKKAKRK